VGSSSSDTSDTGEVEDRFMRERDAYAHLVRSGICNKGSVPKCYGWLQLTPQHLCQILALPDLSEKADELRFTESNPPKALLLEYFAGAVQIDIDNITEELADRAMRAMCDVHFAYVCHNDIHRRNILLLPHDRIVWVDFDHAWVPSCKRGLSRLAILYDAARTWGCLYQDLVCRCHL
jgi:hypothetical protein